MTTLIAGIAIIAAIYKLRRLVFLPRNIYIDGERRLSTPAVLSKLKAQMPDAAVEREIRSWLYPEER